MSFSDQRTLREAAAPLPARLSGLIFDMDGTLYVQGQLRRAIMWRMVRAGVAQPRLTWRELRIVHHYRRAQHRLRRLSEPLAGRQLRLACEWSRARPEEALAAVARWIEDAPLDLLPRCLRPGVPGLLQAAKDKGVRLGLLSDYPAERKLAALGLDGYFSSVVSAQDARVGLFKPSPKGIEIVLAELDVDPAEAVYVGDRPSVDDRAARRAGVACVILGKPLGPAADGWTGAPDIPALQSLLVI